MSWEHWLAIASAITTAVAAIVVAAIRSKEKSEASFARLFEAEMGKRDQDRGDCTQRINTLTGRLDSAEDALRECNAKHDDCQSATRALAQRVRVLEQRSIPPPIPAE